MKAWGILIAMFGFAAVLSLPFLGDSSMKERSEPEWMEQVEENETKVATFAGGCFWCIEAVFEDVKGVKSAVSGYAGGSEDTASYDIVKTGETDHREAVQINYYSSIISYEELLNMYWKSIDPTDPGGQFSDRGPQYTTAIYYHSQEQKDIAERTRNDLEDSDRFDEPIVTEIVKFTTFFPAEDYHQNYSDKNTLSYKAYEKASGREGFVEKIWDETPVG